MQQLALIRHCQSAYAQERYIGKTDTPLTSLGRLQARQVACLLEKMACGPILASPALRARETLMKDDHGIASGVEWDEDLREIDFGRWEGLNFSEIAERDPGLVAEWARNRMDFCFPEGESLAHFWERVKRAGGRIASRPEERLAVVTHGGVIRFLLCYILGLSPEQNRLFQIDLGSVTRLQFHDGIAVLSGLNECCHLEGL